MYAFRASGLFIGTVIGAGFATGEEIRLYFSFTGDGTVILSSLIFGVLCALFLCMGRIREQKDLRASSKVWSAVRFLTVGISLVAMCAAAEQIIYELTSLCGGGMATFLICLFLSGKKSGVISGINAVIVPLIAVFTVSVYIAGGAEGVSVGKISVIPALLYASMNIFSAGIMLEREGRNMSGKQIALSSVISFAIMLVLMLCISKTVCTTADSMPMISVADRVGLGTAYRICVYLAVFTTMLSDLCIMTFGGKSGKMYVLRIALCILLGFVGSAVRFASVVSALYPVIGYCGAVSVVQAIIIVARHKTGRATGRCRSSVLFPHPSFENGDDGVHSAGKSA